MLCGPLVLSALIAAGAQPAPPARSQEPHLCVPASDGAGLALMDGQVHAWSAPLPDTRSPVEPSRTPVLACGSATATALACEGGRAVVGCGDIAGSRKGRLVLLVRDDGSVGGEEGWTQEGEIATELVPRRLLLCEGRLAGVFEDRKGGLSLGFLDAVPRAKMPKVLSFLSSPTSLAVSPDGRSFLVAVGSDLRSFTVKEGATRTITPFPEPIAVVESRPGIPRVLVSQGDAVVAVDPGDRFEKGALPVRARVELPGPPIEIVWIGDGRLAAVRTREGAGPESRMTLLNGEDLSIRAGTEMPGEEALGRNDWHARSIAAAGRDRIAWIQPGDGGSSVHLASISPGLWARAERPSEAPFAAEAPPGAAPGADDAAMAPGVVPSAPAAAERSHAAVSPPPAAPPATTPSTSPPTAPPATTPSTSPPLVPPTATIPPPVTAAPSGGAPSHTPTSRAPSSTSPPRAAPPTVPTTSPPLVPLPSASPPVTAAPSEGSPPAATPLPVTAAPSEGSPPPAPHRVPTAAPDIRPHQALPAGTIHGTISGRVDLVDEVVILGPGSALKQLARVKPSKGAGTATFSISGAPAGLYHLIPMGKSGSSLQSRPAVATVSVGGEGDARADFTIDGPL